MFLSSTGLMLSSSGDQVIDCCIRKLIASSCFVWIILGLHSFCIPSCSSTLFGAKVINALIILHKYNVCPIIIIMKIHQHVGHFFNTNVWGVSKVTSTGCQCCIRCWGGWAVVLEKGLVQLLLPIFNCLLSSSILASGRLDKTSCIYSLGSRWIVIGWIKGADFFIRFVDFVIGNILPTKQRSLCFSACRCQRPFDKYWKWIPCFLKEIMHTRNMGKRLSNIFGSSRISMHHFRPCTKGSRSYLIRLLVILQQVVDMLVYGVVFLEFVIWIPNVVIPDTREDVQCASISTHTRNAYWVSSLCLRAVRQWEVLVLVLKNNLSLLVYVIRVILDDAIWGWCIWNGSSIFRFLLDDLVDVAHWSRCLCRYGSVDIVQWFLLDGNTWNKGRPCHHIFCIGVVVLFLNSRFSWFSSKPSLFVIDCVRISVLEVLLSGRHKQVMGQDCCSFHCPCINIYDRPWVKI